MTPEQFTRVADAFPEAALLVSSDGTIRAANRAVDDLGLEKRHLIGRTLFEVTSNPRKAIAEFLRNCGRSTSPLPTKLVLKSTPEIPCRCYGSVAEVPASGAPRQLLLRLLPQHISLQQFAALNEKIEELTVEIRRRNWVEENLRQQHEQLETTLNSIGDAVIVTDADGRVQTLNPVAESLTRWSRAEAVGRPLREIFHIINEQTRELVDSPVDQVLKLGVIVGLANHTVLIARDGTELPIDDSAAPIRDPSGKVSGVILVFRDVSKRKQADEELARLMARSERQRRMHETIMSNFPDHVYVFDPDHRFTYANKPLLTMWNKTLDEVLGKTCLEIGYEPWHAELHDREIDQVIATRKPIRGEVPYAGSGEVRTYDYIFVPVIGEEGEVEAIAGTTRDVTERKKTEIELRQLAESLSEADRRKDEFLATLAHELRNPLAPIRTGLEVLKLANDDLDVVREIRGTMERQVQQMVHLVDDLLDVSRITRGKLQLRTCRVELKDIVRSALEATRPYIDDAGHKLSVSLPDQPIVLVGDPTRLAQILSNLLNNAAKYTPDAGHIRLTAQLEDNHVAIRVADNGLGIPVEMQKQIFEMFGQIERAMETGHTGLGIGLTLVKSLVEMHGGTIEVYSEGSHRGSEFTVRIPMPSESAAVQSAPISGAAKSGQKGRLRVLIVDDNLAAVEMLQLVVRMLGNEVHTAGDGLEAITAAESFRPDVVLMDLGMPRLNGYEAARRIREQEWGRRMVLVALTGWGQDEDKAQTRQAGFDHHLVKPAEPAALQAIFSEVLAKRD